MFLTLGLSAVALIAVAVSDMMDLIPRRKVDVGALAGHPAAGHLVARTNQQSTNLTAMPAVTPGGQTLNRTRLAAPQS